MFFSTRYFFLSFSSKQTHVFVFCLFLFLVGLFFQYSAKASYAPLLPLRSLLTCELFQRDIFEFSFISTWLLNLFSCCLYIILILLWFLKFHLYYILGPRDHPDIVDSFMQLQAQVCFWFLISFTLGFSLTFPLFLLSSCFSLLSSLSVSLSVTGLQGVPSHRRGSGMKRGGGVFETGTHVSLQTLDSASHLATQTVLTSSCCSASY